MLSERNPAGPTSKGGFILVEKFGIVIPLPCRGCTFCGGDCTDGAGHDCSLCV